MKTLEDLVRDGVELNTIYCGDCLELMKELDDKTVMKYIHYT